MSSGPARLPSEIRNAIAERLASAGAGAVVSTTEALSKIREAFPDLGIEDRELIDVIADVASTCGLTVDFDGDGAPKA